ncbi:MAG TPA: cytochrome P450 [Novosphingobium sp.]|nr:cytochrome P450 [Novosphingobium sp.]
MARSPFATAPSPTCGPEPCSAPAAIRSRGPSPRLRTRPDHGGRSLRQDCRRLRLQLPKSRTSPASPQFTRTAAHDTEHRGRRIRTGDRIGLSFLSANRDEDIIEDPFSFRVDRTDCRRVGFSNGAHICRDMHLARMEMRVFFVELLRRLKSLELAGAPRRRLTNFVGGPAYLPVRFTLD